MIHSFKIAISKYSSAIELTPSDHRLYTNRALCYLAIKEWARCHEDAKRATQMKPDFLKGWFLLVKSSMKQGDAAAARFELDMALTILPEAEELLGLKAEIASRASCGAEQKPSTPRMNRAES